MRKFSLDFLVFLKKIIIIIMCVCVHMNILTVVGQKERGNNRGRERERKTCHVFFLIVVAAFNILSIKNGSHSK